MTGKGNDTDIIVTPGEVYRQARAQAARTAEQLFDLDAATQRLTVWMNAPHRSDPRPSSQSVVARPSGGLHTLVAFDICQFGDPRRTQADRLYQRQQMYEIVMDSFALSGLPWSSCYQEDRGDGLLVVLPAGTATGLVLSPLTDHLARLLRRHNSQANSGTRLRLRMAVHAGHVTYDGLGLAGVALNTLFRSLDSAEFKKAFDAAGGDLGVIASELVYTEVVSGLREAGAYRSISIAVKEINAAAWIRLFVEDQAIAHSEGSLGRLSDG